MTDGDASRIEVGSCSNCGRTLRVKPRGLRPNMRLTCKCRYGNNLDIDRATLSEHGAVRMPVEENIYETSDMPLHRLLDGPCLRAVWADADAEYAERWKDLPQWSRPGPSDVISVSVNPYAFEPNARVAMRTLVERIGAMDRARPWSVELFENVECSIIGLLDAPYFVIVGMTEIGGSGADTYEALMQITSGLLSDDARAQSGGEWEICGQNVGNQWRADRCARLLERWVFLDVDAVETFGAGARQRR
jgi:hypothetical protein